MDNRIPIIALISSFYIFGLSAFYTGGQIVFASAICLILVLLALFDKLKTCIMYSFCAYFSLQAFIMQDIKTKKVMIYQRLKEQITLKYRAEYTLYQTSAATENLQVFP